MDVASLLALPRRRKPGINRATVWRTIDRLKKPGLIDEFDLMHMEGEKDYYEVKLPRDHIRLNCLRCGRIREFSTPFPGELKNVITEQTGFDVSLTRLEAGRTCAVCRCENGAEGPTYWPKRHTVARVKEREQEH